MRELTNWLRREAERQEGLISLQDALLSDRSDAYGWVRLRYFVLRLAVASALHAIKIALLYQVFSRREFLVVLLLQTAVGLASNFWWGLLELMRKRVRDLYRSGTAHRISREVGTWLSLSIQISIVTAFVSLSWVLWQVLVQGRAPDAAVLYVLFVLLGFALNVPARCYHSGIYALRRIYRPPVAIVVIELLSFAGVLALWPWLGVWSLPAGGIVSTLAATGVMVHYTRRTYSALRFNPSEFVRIGRFRLPFRGAVAEALESGLSHAVMAMDSILVFTLFAGRTGDAGGLALFAVFFAASPLIRAASDWARLFYFDLKRLEVRPFGNLRKRFEKQVLRLTWPVSFLLWAFAMVIATLVFQTNLGALYAFMLPFFVAQSLLAAAQVQFFSREAYREVLKSGLLVVSGFMVLGMLGTTERVKLLSFSAIILAAFFVLRARQSKVEKEIESRQLLWPVEWLARIREVTKPVRVSAAEFPENGKAGQARGKSAREDLWRRSLIAERIAARLGSRGGVTLFSPGRIVWYEEADCYRPVTEGWILSLGAGLFQSIRSTGVQERGTAAFNAAVLQKIPGAGLSEDLDGVQSVRFADVRGDFVSRFPDGLIYDAREPAADFLDGLSPAERHSIWRDAIEFVRGTGLYTVDSPFEVTAFCPAGELRAIFVVDRRAPRRLRSGWRRAILRFNLRASAGQVVG